MRILIVGSFGMGALERSYESALTRAGVQVSRFPWPHPAVAAQRFLNRRGIELPAAAWASRRLVAVVKDLHPEVVLVFKGLFLEPSAIDSIKQHGALAVCLNADDPYWPQRTHRSRWLVQGLPRWDLYLTWARFMVERMRADGLTSARYLPFAWDDTLHPHRSEHTGEISLSFVGNGTPHRARWLRSIDVPMEVFGNRWEGVLPTESIRLHPQRLGSEYADVVARTLLNLNLINPHNVPAGNMRSFEIPGIGGCIVSTYGHEIAAQFPSGEAALYVHRPEDLQDALRWAERNPAAVRELAEAGHAIARSQTYDARAAELLAYVHQIRPVA